MAADSQSKSDETLRREVATLGRLFGEVLKQFAGEGAFALVEEIRGLAKRCRDGEESAGDELAKLLSTKSGDELQEVIKAFSGFLELANLAEDRQRVRALRRRERDSAPAPRRESIRAGLLALKEVGFTADRMAEALASIDIELVFTAHPTEAKRKSLRSKLRAIRGLLTELDEPDLLPSERAQSETKLRGEIVKLWQTDLVRPLPPTVMEEVQRGLSFQPVLWRTVPQVMGELRESVQECYPDGNIAIPPVLRFGSWMGGDRDGHPGVLPETTEETVLWLRRAAIEAHLRTCRELLDSLSMSCESEPGCPTLEAATTTAIEQWPELEQRLSRIAQHEGYRRWLKVIQWRLRQTELGRLNLAPAAGEYPSADALATDVRLIAQALSDSGNTEALATDLQPWLDQIDAFGFCTARLDIRQHSGVYKSVMDEIWQATHFTNEGDAPLTETARQELLLRTLPIAANLSPVGLSGDAEKTLDLFRVLRRTARRFGMDALGGHVISMTCVPSDLLTVLWLWKWSERTDTYLSSAGGTDTQDNHTPVELAELDASLLLPIVPLFETIEDLQAATKILTTALDLPAYRDHVRQLGDRQIVMIGYSDSTKDGGYLSAAWSLQNAQVELTQAAATKGVDLTFFHGRGGSLGRGGGPAARAILSLPTMAFDGTLRLTEQGEVLAERYDDPQIAHRHLEQVVWSVLMTRAADGDERPEAWTSAIGTLADSSLEAYRGLVDHPGFVPFFRTATPIAGIEGLRIGSRPAKRKQGFRIEDLRAIPWVFSWTQCRCLLPAWYGVGSAVESFLASTDNAADLLCDMYENWSFFRATIDNSTLAVAKSNMQVFRRYVQLAQGEAGADEIATLLDEEYERTRRAICTIIGCDELLDDTPWLKRSINVRNGYVDPLNFVQIELMQRAAKTQSDELSRLTQRAIKGVAAGMRTTG